MLGDIPPLPIRLHGVDAERGGECSTNGRDEKCIQNFGQKSEWKRPLERPRHRWEDNIRMDLKEIGSEVLTGCVWLSVGTSGGFS
jgi:hypothetical protein